MIAAVDESTTRWSSDQSRSECDELEPDEAHRALLLDDRHGQHGLAPEPLEAQALRRPARAEVGHPGDVDGVVGVERLEPAPQLGTGDHPFEPSGPARRPAPPTRGSAHAVAALVDDVDEAAVDVGEPTDDVQRPRRWRAPTSWAGRWMKRRGHAGEQVLELEAVAQGVERGPAGCRAG